MSKSDLKAKIQAVFDEMCKEYNTNNVERFLDTFSDDAQCLPPGEKLVSGKKDIGKLLTRHIEKYSDVSIDVHEVGSAGGNEEVYSLAVYNEQKLDGSGTVTGKTLTIWKLIDGQYKIYQYIWNTDSA
ncbi:uncharacterized protein LOC102802984 [Saccoglossus kowalevskii]|uniref:Uncharacterized protein LOC102802984 n=1 Tax=Saccoglossus kowalevskii TaxID=10224 RepID=A0ABM0MM59_SACKO|nr:PREDICTED: uncharacterized protein LOC102802984 [Saccoglossus kowalevskii]